MTDEDLWRGARIERVDQPDAAMLCLTLGEPVRGCLTVSTAGPRIELALLNARPKGERATPWVTQLRQHVVGARLLGVRSAKRTVLFDIARRQDSATLFVEKGRVALIDGEGQRVIVRGRFVAPPPTVPWTEHGPRTLGDHADVFVQTHQQHLSDATRSALLAKARTALKKATGRATAIEADLQRAHDAETLRKKAQLLLSAQHTLTTGQPEVTLDDWTVDPPVPITFAIDPTLSPTEQAEAWFKRSRKLERAGVVGVERMEESQRRVADLSAFLEVLADAPDADLARLTADAQALGVEVGRSPTTTKHSHDPPTRRPYRKFVSADGLVILVGRTAKDNDTVTLKHARPHDLWLHTRDAAGSHVVVRLDKNTPCPPETLIDAATLAAHYSELKGELRVAVSYTQRRYVRKLKGSPAGSVQVERAKIIVVRVEPERLARLH